MCGQNTEIMERATEKSTIESLEIQEGMLDGFPLSQFNFFYGNIKYSAGTSKEEISETFECSTGTSIIELLQ